AIHVQRPYNIDSGPFKCIRYTAVGQVVGVQMVIAHGDTGGGAQAKRNGGSNAPALVVHSIASGDIGRMKHAVQAEGRGVGQLPPAIVCTALGVGSAYAQAGVGEVIQLSCLADQVDTASGPASSAVSTV